MARYIDADKIHQFVEDSFKGDVPYEWAWTLTAIDKEPTADVVPVVRCKDCLYAREIYGKLECIHGVSYRNSYNRPDDYCNYGERRCE